MGFARVLLSLLVLVSTSALQLQPMVRVAAVGASPLRVPAAPRCQFGQNKPDTEHKETNSYNLGWAGRESWTNIVSALTL